MARKPAQNARNRGLRLLTVGRSTTDSAIPGSVWNQYWPSAGSGYDLVAAGLTSTSPDQSKPCHDSTAAAGKVRDKAGTRHAAKCRNCYCCGECSGWPLLRLPAATAAAAGSGGQFSKNKMRLPCRSRAVPPFGADVVGLYARTMQQPRHEVPGGVVLSNVSPVFKLSP